MEKTILTIVNAVLANKARGRMVVCHEDELEISLLDYPFLFDCIDLVYLFFEFEKAFNITIPQQSLLNISRISVKGIRDIICITESSMSEGGKND